MSAEQRLVLDYERDGVRYRQVIPRAVIGDPVDNGDGTTTYTVNMFPSHHRTRWDRFKAWLRKRVRDAR